MKKRERVVLIVDGVRWEFAPGDALDLQVDFDVDHGRSHFTRRVKIEVAK